MCVYVCLCMVCDVVMDTTEYYEYYTIRTAVFGSPQLYSAQYWWGAVCVHTPEATSFGSNVVNVLKLT